MNTKKVFGIILVVFGGIFLLSACLFGLIFGGTGAALNYASNGDDTFRQEATTKTCTGEVLRAEEGEGTLIAYQVDGEDYALSVNSYYSEYGEGASVTVYYNENDPSEAEAPEIMESALKLTGGIFSGIGIGIAVIFAVVGIAGVVVGILLLKSAAKQRETTQN